MDFIAVKEVVEVYLGCSLSTQGIHYLFPYYLLLFILKYEYGTFKARESRGDKGDKGHHHT